jgi:hypothetical protein
MRIAPSCSVIKSRLLPSPAAVICTGFLSPFATGFKEISGRGGATPFISQGLILDESAGTRGGNNMMIRIERIKQLIVFITPA